MLVKIKNKHVNDGVLPGVSIQKGVPTVTPSTLHPEHLNKGKKH